MKAVIFILGILFITQSNAQKFDCASNTTAYKELLKTDKVSESFDIWSDVRKNCPKENEAVYTDGIQILQYKIENATAETKEKAVRDLLKLYDQYNKNFPASVPDFEIKKAMALIDNKIDAKEEIFSLLDSGFTKAPKSTKNAGAILTYFNMYSERFKAGDKKITSDSLLEKYTLVNSLLSGLQNSDPENRNYRTAQRAIDNQIKNYTSCENLSDFYAKNYTANQEKPEWLSSALMSLSDKCSSKPIFGTMAEKLYAIKATSQSANFLALANLNQRKFPEAIQYYNESADLMVSPLEKAKTYYMLATGVLANDFPKSKEYLNKALASNPKMGRAYLFLSQLYSNSANDCGKTDFEKKAIVYLAIETAKKAALVEERLKSTSNKTIEKLAPKSLTPAEISQQKMNGKSITIGCWINETISFPSK